MAVMVGGAGLGLSLMFSKDAETVARQIDEGLTEARTAAMSRAGKFVVQVSKNPTSGEVESVTIVQDDSSEYKKIEVQKSATVVFSDGAGISLDEFEVQFDKSNGSVYHVGALSSNSMATSKIYTIEVSARNKTSKINLITATGRHYLEK